MDNVAPVSVLITSFNQLEFLKEAVESVLGQTLSAAEIIICDDASTDGSQAYIKIMQAKYPKLIKFILQDTNIGISNNRNIALRQAKSRWSIFLDGDDRFLPEKLEASMSAVETDPSATLFFSNYRYIDERGQNLGNWVDSTEAPPPQGRVLKEVFSKSFPKGSLFRNELIDTQAARDCGLFDADMKIYEDWEFRLRYSVGNKLAYIPEVLSEYRLHGGGISRINPEEHVKFIRLVCLKNAELLRTLSEPDRKEALEGFLQLETRFSLIVTKSLLRRLHLLAAMKNLIRDYSFRNTICATVRRV